MRYFEANGEVRQAISVVKHRTSQHERTIRQFSIGAQGLVFGKPLREFSGILTGTPIYHADVGPADPPDDTP